MTIRFACDCGQQLAARDEYAGRKVKCTSCGEIRVVPAPDAEEEAPSEKIAFECSECGRKMQSSVANAGKKTRCPGCSTVLVIPAAEEEEEATERKARKKVSSGVQSERPLPKPKSARTPVEDEDEPEDEPRDEEDDDDSPKKKKKKKKSGKKSGSGFPFLLVGLIAGGLLLMGGGGGVVAWLLFFSGSDDDLDLVDRNATGFVSMRIADFSSTPLGKKALEAANKNGQLIKELESDTGLGWNDIDRLTVVVPDQTGQSTYAVVLTKQPYDKAKILEKAKDYKEATYEGKKYLRKEGAFGGGEALYFVSKRVLVGGTEVGVKRCLTLGKPKDGPLSDGIKKAADKQYHMVAAMGGLGPALQGAMGPSAAQFKPLAEFKSIILTMQCPGDLTLDLSAVYNDGNAANNAKTTVDQLLGMAKGALQFGAGGMDKAQSQQILTALNEIKPTVDGSSLRMTLKFSQAQVDQFMNLATQGIGGVPGPGPGPRPRPGPGPRTEGPGAPGAGGVAQTANRMKSFNNLKQLALAMHNYHDTYGRFPPMATYSKDGRPLLSWRVALLPYLEQDQLYRQFKLDEPWDSPHNIKLVAQMPRVFEMPGASTGPAGSTFYQVPNGPGAIFNNQQSLSIRSINDGTSNTILIAEAKQAVPWTKPADLVAAPTRNLLGNHHGDGFQCVTADGATHMVPSSVSAKTIRSLFTASGGDLPGPEWKP